MRTIERLIDRFITSLAYLAAAAILGMDLCFLAHGFGLM